MFITVDSWGELFGAIYFVGVVCGVLLHAVLAGYDDKDIDTRVWLECVLWPLLVVAVFGLNLGHAARLAEKRGHRHGGDEGGA